MLQRIREMSMALANGSCVENDSVIPTAESLPREPLIASIMPDVETLHAIEFALKRPLKKYRKDPAMQGV